MPKLTKLDIAEYYSDRAVQEQILNQIANRPVTVVQSLPDKNIYRRNNPDGSSIRITKAEPNNESKDNLLWFTDRRYSEFHPEIGKNTKKIWVDVDPGPNAALPQVKEIVTKVVNSLQKSPEIKDVDITYSGGRGFHVRGTLRKKTETDTAREALTAKLKELEIPGTVFKKPTGSDVRLDTSTLKNRGSLRAAYSLNSETGRVALPLTPRELRGFQPEQADLKRVLSEKEFAPGIPRSRRMYALPTGPQSKDWMLAIQEHDAAKAGKHWDLRLVDQDTGFAHSWAVPKTKLPEQGGRPVLAVRTPTHTENYALNFGAEGPKTIGEGYGKGVVQIVRKEPVEVPSVKDTSIRFKTKDSKEEYLLFKTKKDNWLIKNVSTEKVGHTMGTSYRLGYAACFEKLGVARGVMNTLSTAETKTPLDNSDAHTAAGALTQALQSADFVPPKRVDPKIVNNWNERSTDQEADWGPLVNATRAGLSM